jgi:hypothetical protein
LCRNSPPANKLASGGQAWRGKRATYESNPDSRERPPAHKGALATNADSPTTQAIETESPEQVHGKPLARFWPP